MVFRGAPPLLGVSPEGCTYAGVGTGMSIPVKQMFKVISSGIFLTNFQSQYYPSHLSALSHLSISTILSYRILLNSSLLHPSLVFLLAPPECPSQSFLIATSLLNLSLYNLFLITPSCQLSLTILHSTLQYLCHPLTCLVSGSSSR